MGHPSMPRWRYTVFDPVPLHKMCTAKVNRNNELTKNGMMNDVRIRKKALAEASTFMKV